jgi:hypothetical protein
MKYAKLQETVCCTPAETGDGGGCCDDTDCC